MPKAVVLVSSDTSYLERKLSILNYRTYPIDEFNHKNIHMLRDLDFTNNFINMVKSKHSHPYLIYGSGLEDKTTIYKLFSNNLIVKGNNLNMLSRLNDFSLLKPIFDNCNLKTPEYFDQEKYNIKKYIWKPFNGSGGYRISYNLQKKSSHYKQKYLPGHTFSISFICNDKSFKFLGFNQLFLLKDYTKHPFIHAGAMMINLCQETESIITSFRKLAKGLSLKGYNNIDFKIIDNDIFILDINPRITSTFKMYNDICNNNLLKLQLNEDDIVFDTIAISDDSMHGYFHLFAKESFYFKKYLSDDSFANLPKDKEYIQKGEPIFSIYLDAFTEEDLKSKLCEKISNLRNYYNFYDIVI